MGLLGNKVLCRVVIAVLLIQWSGLPPIAAAQTVSAANSPARVAAKLEKMFDALEVAAKEIPRDTFDPQAIVDKVGPDPEQLFAWVRDNTYLVPYRGVLRGPVGVLMDRLGNSLDRALLLAVLLHGSGHEVRLAQVDLEKEQARELLKKARSITEGGLPTAPRLSRRETSELAEKYAVQFELDARHLRKLIGQITVEQQRIAEEALQRTAEQAAAIAAAVEGFRKNEAPEARKAAYEEALKDHWWVRWKNGSTWVDLDPSLPDAAPGQLLVTAKQSEKARTIAAFNGQGKLSLDGGLYHEVEIRIKIEQWKKGRLGEKQAFKYRLRPSELFGQHIVLRHHPMDWPRDWNLFAKKEPLQRLKSTVLAQDEWVPILLVGSDTFVDSSFTDSGDLIDNPQNRIGAALQVLGRKSIFGAARSAAGIEPTPKSDGLLTAEWIEYVIRSPGREDRTIRREIFDLLGPGARSAWIDKGNVPAPNFTKAQRLERGLALMGQTDILPLVSQLSPEFLEYLAIRNLRANRKILLSVIRNIDSADPNAFANQVGKLKLLPGPSYSLALARREWSGVRGDVYLDRPNILSYHTGLQQSPQGQFLIFRAFDIVANNVAVQLGSDADPFLVRLEQGVLDTNAEALLAAKSRRKIEGNTVSAEVVNTAEIFATSYHEGDKWLTVTDADDPAWLSTVISKNVRARIDQILADGYLVIVPKQPVLHQGGAGVGWWQVNRKTGQTLGIGERGWGSATEKFVLMTAFTAVLMGELGYFLCVYAKNLVAGQKLYADLTRKDRAQCICVGVGIGAATGALAIAAGPTAGWAATVSIDPPAWTILATVLFGAFCGVISAG